MLRWIAHDTLFQAQYFNTSSGSELPGTPTHSHNNTNQITTINHHTIFGVIQPTCLHPKWKENKSNNHHYNETTLITNWLTNHHYPTSQPNLVCIYPSKTLSQHSYFCFCLISCSSSTYLLSIYVEPSQAASSSDLHLHVCTCCTINAVIYLSQIFFMPPSSQSFPFFLSSTHTIILLLHFSFHIPTHHFHSHQLSYYFHFLTAHNTQSYSSLSS